VKKKLRNKFEKRIASQLRRTKVKFEYESECFNYILSRTYTPDFIITKSDGSKIFIEAKGYLRTEHKSKLVAVKKQHPEIDLRIVFYRYIEQYIKWAEKHGFIWAIEKIPKEWLNDEYVILAS
jgi:Phage endonuclease I